MIQLAVFNFFHHQILVLHAYIVMYYALSMKFWLIKLACYTRYDVQTTHSLLPSFDNFIIELNHLVSNKKC